MFVNRVTSHLLSLNFYTHFCNNFKTQVLQYTRNPETVNYEDPEFKSSNVIHHVNGRSYCNLDGLSILQTRNARWYVISLGDGLSGPRWYGHDGTIQKRRAAAALIQPGTSVATVIDHYSRGLWLFSDQVTSNAYSGVSALFSNVERVTVSCENKFWASC